MCVLLEKAYGAIRPDWAQYYQVEFSRGVSPHRTLLYAAISGRGRYYLTETQKIRTKWHRGSKRGRTRAWGIRISNPKKSKKWNMRITACGANNVRAASFRVWGSATEEFSCFIGDTSLQITRAMSGVGELYFTFPNQQ